MKRVIVLCLLFVFAFSAVSYANLDAPAEKKVTVKTEIDRGKSAVHAAERSAGALKPQEFTKDVDFIINKNKQNNTDTDAFYMGVYGQAWIYAVIRCGRFSESKDFWKGRMTDGQIKSFERNTAWYYEQFRLKQKELGISDADLKKLFTFKEEWLTEWDKRTAE
ncbi:hypothetical protein M7775_19115 [Sporomusa sphaeroides DSM 2875]|uniref:hypothetical protein n=1 Tax=Sporomusa sphaeroides TaxID=47679 RepID=UPI00202EA5A9|nr:hypothetical protein [Sporomusa sphaeroides]MCM0760664.1 hypothetical protein [Sporomusa sphaeroides DSM 2875]